MINDRIYCTNHCLKANRVESSILFGFVKRYKCPLLSDGICIPSLFSHSFWYLDSWKIYFLGLLAADWIVSTVSKSHFIFDKS